MPELREFLVKDCQNNKQIKSCQECRYEQECDQIHINLIIKAIGQWLAVKRETAQSNYGHNEVSNAYYNGYFFAIDELIESVERNEAESK